MNNVDIKRPIRLQVNRVWRTSVGGKLIDELHNSVERRDTHFSEDWLASVTTARNIGREEFQNEGLSIVSGADAFLKDVILEEPKVILGKKHYEAHGDELGVLLKTIDMAERGTIHSHPDKQTAQRLFNAPFGKTECVHIVALREEMMPVTAHFGFKEWVTREDWMNVFDLQDIEAMLNCMNRYELQVGDTFIIRAGLPHSMGAGCMFMEMQEPTDFTIRVERKSSSGMPISDYMCHQGLGWEKMFDCFKYDHRTSKEIYRDIYLTPVILDDNESFRISEIVGYKDTSCFKTDRYDIHSECRISTPDSFSVLYVQEGTGNMTYGDSLTPLKPGDRFFLSAACNDFALTASRNSILVVYRFWGPQ